MAGRPNVLLSAQGWPLPVIHVAGNSHQITLNNDSQRIQLAEGIDLIVVTLKGADIHYAWGDDNTVVATATDHALPDYAQVSLFADGKRDIAFHGSGIVEVSEVLDKS